MSVMSKNIPQTRYIITYINNIYIFADKEVAYNCSAIYIYITAEKLYMVDIL